MKKSLAGGCAALVLSVFAVNATTAEERRFAARLLPVAGALPPDVPGRGMATFTLSADRTRLAFEVAAHDVEGVTQIHIHVGEPAQNVDGVHYHLSPEKREGPIVAFLLDFVPGGVPARGTLTTGTLTSADLTGPFSGEAMAIFIEHVEQGATYVNVHIGGHVGKGCCPAVLRGVIGAR